MPEGTRSRAPLKNPHASWECARHVEVFNGISRDRETQPDGGSLALETRTARQAMFDLVTGQSAHIPSKPTMPLAISVATQGVLIAAVVVPVLFFTGSLPEVPTMIAFVAAAPAPTPPPPPPPPPAATPTAPRDARPVTTSDAAPVEPPSTIAPERPVEGEPGVAGGVEGGVPDGIVGGIVGGLPAEIAPPPPPPPPPPAARVPVRVGGNIKPPEVIHKVNPVYPDIAVSAHMRGMVILEAQVDSSGSVVDVKVLRSVNRLLDEAAVVAVRQWRYRPVILNGIPEPFILTVVLTFDLTDS
jgi:protein TonB